MPPAWLFGLAAVPYGSFNGLVAVGLPYILRRHGFPVERIAAIGALVQAPAIWYFLWAPVVDIKFRRRTWILFLSFASACFTMLALGVAIVTARTVTVLLVLASVFNQPVLSALGGLMSGTVPNAVRGRAAGWSEAGMLGGGVFLGGLAVWLAGFAHPAVIVLTAGVLIAAPALVVLAIEEPQPARPGRREHLVRMAREVARMLKRRDAWLAIAFFLSPVSAGALMNLFSAVAADFKASASAVLLVVAIGAVMTTAGALVGGVVLDRFDRWRVYPTAGLMAAACAGAMLLAPLKPITYVAGAAAYAFVTGFGYAAFMALALEVLGSETAASGTRFTLFMAASNVPLVYMLRLDGVGHAHFGVRGMLAADAIANATFGLLLLAILAWLRSEHSRTGIHGALGATAAPDPLDVHVA